MKAPWSGDAQAMLLWLEPKLREKLIARARHIVTREELTPLETASKGDIEPLRRQLVELTGNAEVARFVNLPKQPRGKQWHPAKKPTVQPPEIAEWAKIIREIWNEYYGKKYRRKSEWTAEEFAFALFMMDAEVEENFDPSKREEHSDIGKRWSDRAADKNKQ